MFLVPAGQPELSSYTGDHPWEWSRSGWMGIWAAWCSADIPAHGRGLGTRLPLRSLPSHHFIISWLVCVKWPGTHNHSELSNARIILTACWLEQKMALVKVWGLKQTNLPKTMRKSFHPGKCHHPCLLTGSWLLPLKQMDLNLLAGRH